MTSRAKLIIAGIFLLVCAIPVPFVAREVGIVDPLEVKFVHAAPDMLGDRYIDVHLYNRTETSIRVFFGSYRCKVDPLELLTPISYEPRPGEGWLWGASVTLSPGQTFTWRTLSNPNLTANQNATLYLCEYRYLWATPLHDRLTGLMSWLRDHLPEMVATHVPQVLLRDTKVLLPLPLKMKSG